ncbi:methionine adenosyltransferase [Alphaproteobacteria bacterium]|nr:methionine adenosyltransferase [Alphaproteobacteria bacterium]
MSNDYLFTSESVSEGHPDKICDRISDTVVDLMLEKFPEARVACETMVSTNRTIIAGEYRLPNGMEISNNVIEKHVRKAVQDIGYEQENYHWEKMNFECYLHSQSENIALGVDQSGNKDEGAGDQGLMFGFACDETDDFMPAPIHYSHKILKEMSILRHADRNSLLLPDSKSQITLHYRNGKPVKAASIVVSTQHVKGCSQEDIKDIVRSVLEKVLPKGWMCPEDEFYVNPTGIFEIGGPDGDAGLTGRKIIVDTYGGAAPHGGGAFSGKDPTKVDRSAAYLTRYLAKNVVAAKIASRCTIQIAYAIGISKPLSLYVNTDGTGIIEDTKIASILNNLVDMSPRGIRQHLKLNKPIYVPTSAYGHFGRNPDEGLDGSFSWEKTDLVNSIIKESGI